MSVVIDRRSIEEQLKHPIQIWVDPTLYPQENAKIMAQHNQHKHNQQQPQKHNQQQPQKHGNQQNQPQNKNQQQNQPPKQPPAQPQAQQKPAEAAKPPSAPVAMPAVATPGETRRRRKQTLGEKLKKTNGLVNYLRVDGPMVTPRDKHGEPQAAKKSEIPYGCIVAIDMEHIGWSRVSVKDQFDYDRALAIAMGRASTAKPLAQFFEKYKQGKIVEEKIDDHVEKFIVHKDLRTPVTMIFNIISSRPLVRWEGGHIIYEDMPGIPTIEHRVDMAIEILKFYEYAKKHFSGELARENEQRKAQKKLAEQKGQPAAQGKVAGAPAPQVIKHAPPGNTSSGHTAHNQPQHQAFSGKKK